MKSGRAQGGGSGDRSYGKIRVTAHNGDTANASTFSRCITLFAGPAMFFCLPLLRFRRGAERGASEKSAGLHVCLLLLCRAYLCDSQNRILRARIQHTKDLA